MVRMNSCACKAGALPAELHAPKLATTIHFLSLTLQFQSTPDQKI